jgi:hypothetical protein
MPDQSLALPLGWYPRHRCIADLPGARITDA